MGLTFNEQWLELTGELEKMADAFVDNGGDASDLKGIVKAGAEVILNQAKLNAPVRSGTLKDSLKIAMKKKGTYTKARIGVQKGSGGFYATFVEYGHGGPHPAGPHPFLAPAFDAKKEEALSVIKGIITDKLTKL